VVSGSGKNMTKIDSGQGSSREFGLDFRVFRKQYDGQLSESQLLGRVIDLRISNTKFYLQNN
jgi:hypothetical protein